MTTVEKAEGLVTKLDRFNVPALAYQRGPNGPATFTMAIKTGELYVWAGSADITVAGSKQHRQAVINVTEKKRSVTKEVTVKTHGYGVHIPGDREFQANFPVAFPSGAKVEWTVKDKKHAPSKGEKDKSDVGYVQRTYKAKVTAKVPETKQCFLVGYDEHALFVSMLPKQVKTVAEAHALLRPKGVSENAVRQGEWFFDPVADTLGNALDRALRRNTGSMQFGAPDGTRYGRSTTHRCCTMEFRNKVYAIGYVLDVRGEKTETHHEPLWLNDWHRVTKNTEVEPPRSMGRQRRSFD